MDSTITGHEKPSATAIQAPTGAMDMATPKYKWHSHVNRFV